MSPAKPTAKPTGPFGGDGVGYMTVSLQVGEVKMTIEGPLVQVLKFLETLFGAPPTSSAVIAKLQLVFGPEFGKK